MPVNRYCGRRKCDIFSFTFPFFSPPPSFQFFQFNPFFKLSLFEPILQPVDFDVKYFGEDPRGIPHFSLGGNKARKAHVDVPPL